MLDSKIQDMEIEWRPDIIGMQGTSPFKGDKGTTWEGGVRVPFMFRWPVLIDMRRDIGFVIANWTYRIRNSG
jgi:hypothetical protein